MKSARFRFSEWPSEGGAQRARKPLPRRTLWEAAPPRLEQDSGLKGRSRTAIEATGMAQATGWCDGCKAANPAAHYSDSRRQLCVTATVKP